MRIVGVVLAVLAGLACLALSLLESIVRAGTCGPSEGGGSCDPGLAAHVLPVAAVLFLIGAAALCFRR